MHPSKQITKAIQVSPPINLPTSILPGALILLPQTTSVISINIDGKDFTAYKKYLFAVPPLKSSILISGSSKITPSSLFNHSKEYFFKKEIKINLDKNFIKLSIPISFLQQKISIEEQKKRLKAFYIKSKHTPKFLSCFQIPLNSKRISKFAEHRQINQTKKYYHQGLDLRAWTNTPIPSSADGKVALVDEFYVSGKTVVIDHGFNLFTAYFHLNKFNVRSGQNIKNREIIGFSGSTGRSQAPHLHWELIWKGNHANPEIFLQTVEQICGPS